ncbi:hypothetical protein RBY4I_1152 [Rhodobacterales bacterium Y4I]|nr:hypothetical protein RBY4I_1152 [Rhodobacterales bacterium Y4I]
MSVGDRIDELRRGTRKKRPCAPHFRQFIDASARTSPVKGPARRS